MFRRKIVTKIYCAIIAGSMQWSAPCLAGPQIPGFYGKLPNLTPPVATAVPQLKGIVQGVTNVVHDQAQNKLTVNQDKDKAILDWNTFDIGQDAWTHFNQRDANNIAQKDWAALNRIWDKNPSQIYGKLTADGRVYLINQNGILFGPSSRVNVHSLIASSLNIKDEDFLNGALRFKAENYINPTEPVNSNVAVSNHGVIETDELGSVFLLGPTVENSGVLTSPIGQVGLIAANEAEIVQDLANTNRTAPVVHVVEGPGQATNFGNGWIIADVGLAGMYGQVVNQEGLIRSVTAIKKGGTIELQASERVSTGSSSLISTPVSTSAETADKSFQFTGGTVDLGGLTSPFYDPSGNLGGFGSTASSRIELRGSIEAPSGLVNLRAGQRVFIETGSKISVGGLWVDKAAEANLVEAQLNTVELRDDYGQKYGLLKGKKINFDSLYGSTIGDISGSLNVQQISAAEQATKAGSVLIDGSNGDIIIKHGAQIDFSGGGIRYSSGHVETTKLLGGRTVFDISEAPEWISYDKIMGLQETTHTRFGLTEEFRGLYTGGANAVRGFLSERLEGSDAGSLTLLAKKIVLDGDLNGAVVKGLFQTKGQETEDAAGNQVSRGSEEPRGGKLLMGVQPLGAAPPETQDFRVDEVIIKSQLNRLPPGFGPSDPLPGGYSGDGLSSSATGLSADKLNAARLGRLEIYANSRIVIDEGANISIPSRRYLSDLEKRNDANLAEVLGGYFSGAARRIEIKGSITVPAGGIDLSLKDNVTSFSNIFGLGNPLFRALQQRIYLSDASSLSVAGERIDNSNAGRGGLLKSVQTTGGNIRMHDDTATGEGVIIPRGALIDVSGGYEIDQKGRITGGDAGNLDIGGPSVVLDGLLKGLSLIGKKGGTITLSGLEASITSVTPSLPVDFGPDSVLPQGFGNKLIIGQTQLGESGFTDIAIRSTGNLTVEQGASFSPSDIKVNQPFTMQLAGSVIGLANNTASFGNGGSSGGTYTRVSPETISSSSVKLSAGQGLSAADAAGIGLTMGEGSRISVFPGGTIEMQGPRVSIAGAIEAPAGKVTLKSSFFDLTLQSGSRINASGYNRRELSSVMAGYPAGFTPLAGGTVTLDASSKNIILERESLVDVSGSEPVITYAKVATGKPEELTVAGDPGSLILSYGQDLILGGDLLGFAKMKGLRGGALTVSSPGNLAIMRDAISLYQTSGFDDLTFKSITALKFPNSLDIKLGRRLTLDAPRIEGLAESRVFLSAPWVRLINTYYPASDAATPGKSQFTFSGDWIDVEGSTVIAGSLVTSLKSKNDIRLSDRFYEVSNLTLLWKGGIETAGDLILQADRIFPTTLSHFAIKAGGEVTILPAEHGADRLIPSAGGNLHIMGNKIMHSGFLAAPMGAIVLEGIETGGSVVLSKGSRISTAGGGLVKYGSTDETFWTIPDKAADTLNATINVEEGPRKSVAVNGDSVFIEDGAEIDVSGGGKVFTYQFYPSPAGTNDPLKKTGRYVIMPDHSVALPGDAVYLEGGDGLNSGVYSLLPEEYAFLPGALILTDLSKAGISYTFGQKISQEGYALLKGYSTVMGTDILSTKPKGYSLRKAEEVLKEGFFTTRELDTGEAGSITVTGKTTLLDGTLKAKAQEGYRGGSLSLSADSIIVGHGAALPGSLVVNPDVFLGMDLEELDLGYNPGAGNPQDRIIANSVTIDGGSAIKASKIIVGGKREILLKSRAELHAVSEDGNGFASLLSPEGKVVLEEQGLVHASDKVNLDVKDLDLRGEIRVDNSAISLTGAKIFFVPEGYVQKEPGLYLTQARLDQYNRFEELTLVSKSDLLFLGDFNVSARNSLILDAERIAAAPAMAAGKNDWTVSISAASISLLNTGTQSIVDKQADTGTITFSASELSVGHGDIRFDGFKQVNLEAQSDVIFRGKGSLTAGGADLNITAPRVTTSFYKDETTNYEVAGYTLDAGNRTVKMNNGAGTPGLAITPGGRLEINARTIDLSTIVDVNSGQVRFNASGTGANEGIFLRQGAQLLAKGSDYAPGGSVRLRTGQGVLSLAAGTLVDVSAGGQGDAGTISLFAPVGGVSLDGALSGLSSGGQGGSFEMDTIRISDFSALNNELSAGGFAQSIGLRARTGNVAVDPGQQVATREFRLSVDQGNLSVYGEIDASGKKVGEAGGRVELYAGNLLYLYPEARIYAKGNGAGAAGGEVFLGTSSGHIATLSGSLIDVSGGHGGIGGTVSFRAPRFESVDVKEVFGTIAGAESVFVEAVKVYSYTGNKTITSDDFGIWQGSGWWKETDDFMQNAPMIETRLLGTLMKDGWTEDKLHLLPGIEVRSSGDLTIASDWDLTSWRFGGEAGVLALRAAGNLNVFSNVIDHPTPISSLPGAAGRDSWAINLIAGGSLGSADLLAVERGSVNLIIGPANLDAKLMGGKMVYSESAPVRFASGGDALLRSGPSSGFMINPSIRYTLGSYDSRLEGNVEGTLTLTGAAIQTATGEIAVNVGNDLILGYGNAYASDQTVVGSVRTTGRHPLNTGSNRYWEFSSGGDILLRIAGSVMGTVNQSSQALYNAWDRPYQSKPRVFDVWAASYPWTVSSYRTTEGIATMAGGNITVLTGGDFFSQIGTFGEGDLRVYAGGDIDGRFLTKQGKGNINSFGNFGMTQLDKQVIELFAAQVDLTAHGDIKIGSIVNPLITHWSSNSLVFTDWNLQYTTDSSVTLKAVSGDVLLLGDSAFHTLPTDFNNRERVLPPTLKIYAGRDILLQNEFALTPSPTSNLILEAGRDVNGGYGRGMRSSIVVSDMQPSDVYGMHKDFAVSSLFNGNEHAASPMHEGDPLPIHVRAGYDIKNLQLFLPKKAEISAGQDIRDIYYFGQNVSLDDHTLIMAGRDLLFNSEVGTIYETGIVHGGPGTLIVQAGGNIDLGTTSGIQTVGSGLNTALGIKGSDLILAAGIDGAIQPDEIKPFFDDLRKAGIEYARLRNSQDIAGAALVAEKARDEIIAPLIGGAFAKLGGRIDMTRSQISTSAADDHIYFMTRGDLNVGKSAFVSDAERKNTGIFTAAGGSINVLCGGDVNVNESRGMTFRGGDITVYALWNDDSTVNAGRGSKTAINVEPPKFVPEYEYVNEGGKQVRRIKRITLVFEPPAIGSGIRTLTYDPDGLEGPLDQPLAGDIYIFAKTIDAGEAGIAGRNVILGAAQVLNAQNISFSVGSVGVPVASTGAVGIGALAGVSSLTEVGKMTEQAAGMAGSRAEAAQQAAKMMEEFTAKWVDVKVIGFE